MQILLTLDQAIPKIQLRLILREWRNWQTRATQNRIPTRSEGSSPSLRTKKIYMKIVQQDEAVILLKRGDLVVVPTETVYGLAADGLNPEAVKKIFEAKERPSENPLILHVSSLNMLEGLVKNISIKSKILMQLFWPGPLTLVFDKKDLVPDIVTAGLDTVCVRMPKQDKTLSVIEALGKPLAAPSANKSGRPSPTNLSDLEKEMPDLAVIDGGQTELGLESTVIDARGEEVRVLRLGSLEIEKIENALGEKVVMIQKGLKAHSPGQNFRHYSPNAQVILVWPWESFGEKISSDNKSPYATVEEAIADLYDRYKCGIICDSSREELYLGYDVLSLGNGSAEHAKNLFEALHKTEALFWDKVIVDMSKIDLGSGLALTVVERLKRAAE